MSLFTPQVLSILEYLNVGDVLGGVKPAPPTLKTVLVTVEAEEAADRRPPALPATPLRPNLDLFVYAEQVASKFAYTL